MQKQINFITPTQLSFIDLITMGDSSKREDESSIGQFGSGLKYAIALLMRNEVGFTASIRGEAYLGGTNREYNEVFTPYIYNQYDELTEKSKDLIGFNVEREYQSFHTQFNEDCFDAPNDENLETGFALGLGYNWELWMAIREIYSNMLDEGGFYNEDLTFNHEKLGTVITLTFEEGSKFDEIWSNRQNFLHEKEWDWVLSDNVKICRNEDEWLKIYKKSILVHEDKEVQSAFSYEVNSTEIDERRLANNIYSTFNTITTSLATCKDKTLLNHLVGKSVIKCQFLENRSSLYDWVSVSDEWFEYINVHSGEVDIIPFMKDRIKKDARYNHSGRIIESLSSQVYNYSRPVTVEEIPREVEISTIDSIVSEFNINLKGIEIKESALSGRSCVADKMNKTIIISNEFSIEENMDEFIVEYFALKGGNIIKQMSQELVKLLKK